MKKRKLLDIKLEDDTIHHEQNEKYREQLLPKLENELQNFKKDFELRPATMGFVDQSKKGDESQGEEKIEKKSSKNKIDVKPLATLLEPNVKVHVVPKAIVERTRRLNGKPQPMNPENPRKRRKLNTQLELKSPKKEAAPKGNRSLPEHNLAMKEEPSNDIPEVDPLNNLNEDSTMPEADNHDNAADNHEAEYHDNAADADAEINLGTNEEPEVKIEISNPDIVIPKSENNNDNSPNEESVERECQSAQIDCKQEVCKLYFRLENQIIIL